ncbi:hypothetical protein L6452_04274 [Arctium lappa]|uniref:Uncharacterized protein n=1 Tax=Arctium lappa TaxID=4217 RepID=A0ACB9FQ12_ARCLA|nr:hypothetical protein L6452_04274 [Arctium lappa]
MIPRAVQLNLLCWPSPTGERQFALSEFRLQIRSIRFLGFLILLGAPNRSIPSQVSCVREGTRSKSNHAKDHVCHDLHQRAGELSNAEIDNLMTIVANPRQFKIPDWFLNRKKDYKDGKYSQVTSNALDMKLRDDLERLKKIRNHRGLRHYWGLRVRGQHTKTTGRRGKTVGVSKKR